MWYLQTRMTAKATDQPELSRNINALVQSLTFKFYAHD